MAEVAAVNNNISLPTNTYIAQKKNPHLANEDHIIKKHPLIGARITLDKLGKSVFSYSAKGMKGSVNGNFYEYLSMGLIPNIVGSAMLIGLFNGANKFFAHQDKAAASLKGAQFGAGVVLYAVGKWLGTKLITKGVHAGTGIDMDMPYKKFVHELSEDPNKDPKTRVEYHRVYESVDFPRTDLLNKMGEEEGDRYKYWDKIAKRMGYKEKLNSPDQEVTPKIRKTITKARAAQYISSYLWAATGVALGAQQPFGYILDNSFKSMNRFDKIKAFPAKLAKALVKSSKDLFAGRNAEGIINKKAGIMGKTLIFAAIGSTVLGAINACVGFRAKKENGKVVFDKQKEIVEG